MFSMARVHTYIKSRGCLQEVPVSPSALGGPRVVEARALQGFGGLDNSSQPRIRLFLVEFLFALRANL
jgi:hypothetical protein